MDLSAYPAARGVIGAPRRPVESEIARIDLLDEQFTVLSADADAPAAGKNFFALFPAPETERAVLADCLRAFEKRSVLLSAGGEPTLFVGTLVGAAGVIPAILPDKEIREILRAPAAFYGSLEDPVIGPALAEKYQKHKESDVERVRAFLAGVTHPFSRLPAAYAGGTLTSALSHRAAQLARLVGVAVACDTGGFVSRPDDRILADWYTGVLFAVLQAAAHAAGEEKPAVSLYLDRDGNGTPMMHLAFRREKEDAVFAEFLPLAQKARARGAIFDAVAFPERPCEVRVRASLSPAELSAEGLKEKHGLLAGETAPPAPSVLPIPAGVTDRCELSFDK